MKGSTEQRVLNGDQLGEWNGLELLNTASESSTIADSNTTNHLQGQY